MILSKKNCFLYAKFRELFLIVFLGGMRLTHKVDNVDNKLGMLNASFGEIKALSIDTYAAEKGIYLGKKCQVEDEPRPWQFWMIMLKSGNMDTLAAICPENGKKSKPFPQDSRFPCFGKGCMNMPSMYHDYTSIQGKNNNTLRGSFYGSWDLDADVRNGVIGPNTSYYNVTWVKEIGKGSWVFHHYVKTSSKYPWLMLYLRSDATEGFSGGYHYQTRGMSKIVSHVEIFRQQTSSNVKFLIHTSLIIIHMPINFSFLNTCHRFQGHPISK